MKKTLALLLLLASIAQAADVILYSTTAPSASGGVLKTGQTTSYAAGDDGDLEKGVAWPNPRFVIQANTNVVYDAATRLYWTRNFNMGTNTVWGDSSGYVTWANAFVLATNANAIAYGGRSGWRVPNFNELLSLTTRAHSGPPVCNTAGTGKWSEGDPFFNIKGGYYWTSSSDPAAPSSYANGVVFTGYFACAILGKANMYPVALCAGP